MKKFLLTFCFIVFSCVSSLHGMEHFFTTFNQAFSWEFWDSCKKKFDEASWPVQLTAYTVGLCCFIESYLGVRSWLFGKKTATKAEVNEISRWAVATNKWSDDVNKRLKELGDQQITHGLDIVKLKALNPDNRNINGLYTGLVILETFINQDLDGESLKAKLQRVNNKMDDFDDFAKQCRTIILGTIKRSKGTKKYLVGIDEKIDWLLRYGELTSPRSSSSSPRNSSASPKRRSAEFSPRELVADRLSIKGKGKEKVRDKKTKKKNKKGAKRSIFPNKNVDTPRFGYANFLSESEDDSPKTNILSENTILPGEAKPGSNLKKIQPVSHENA